MRMRVAVIYSGRLYSARLTEAWFDNQLRNLIEPNNATVFVAVSVEQWCDVAKEVQRAAALHGNRSAMNESALIQSLLRRDLSAAFHDWPYVHGKLFPQSISISEDRATIQSTHAIIRG